MQFLFKSSTLLVMLLLTVLNGLGFLSSQGGSFTDREDKRQPKPGRPVLRHTKKSPFYMHASKFDRIIILAKQMRDQLGFKVETLFTSSLQINACDVEDALQLIFCFLVPILASSKCRSKIWGARGGPCNWESAAKKSLALVAKGKVNWKMYYNLFTNNGRIWNFVVKGETIRFHLHHILLEDEVGDHTDIHAQASLFISDQNHRRHL